MSDARLSASFPTHPKTKKLMRRLGTAGPWALVCLFLWARMNRADGDLNGMTDEDIELAADWAGDDGVFVAALVAVGFLDGTNGAYRIHDWAEHQPWSAGADDRKQSSAWAALCKRYGREGAAERMPEYAERMRKPSEPSATSVRPACDSDATRMRPAQESHATPTDPQCPASVSVSVTTAKAKELPPSAGEKPPTETDPIFGAGLAFLLTKGVPERSARSWLGLFRRDCGSDLAASQLLMRAEQDDISDPVAWLTKAAKTHKSNVSQLSLVPITPEPIKASHQPLRHTPRG